MRTAKPPEITEKTWQTQLTHLAKTLGWRVYHTFLSRWSDAGFPDLVLVRDRVVYVECKRESGKLSPPQTEWRDALIAAGAEWYCFRLSDFDEAARVLQRRKTTMPTHLLVHGPEEAAIAREILEASDGQTD